MSSEPNCIKHSILYKEVRLKSVTSDYIWRGLPHPQEFQVSVPLRVSGYRQWPGITPSDGLCVCVCCCFLSET